MILVISTHHPHYPCQIDLLDVHTGKPTREYWHSGFIGVYIPTVLFADRDANGIQEIYLAGISTARHLATLVVLDPDSFEGYSFENNGAYQLKGSPPGREIRRILFPRFCTELASSNDGAVSVYLSENSLVVEVPAGPPAGEPPVVYYHFSPDGSLSKLEFSNAFYGLHETEQRAGRLNHSFNEKERRAMADSVTILSHR